MQWMSVLLSLFELVYTGSDCFPSDELSQVTTTANGQLLVVGSIVVDNFDDGCEDDALSYWNSDTYIARLTSDTETVLWEKSYGWIKDDVASAIGEYPDGTIQVVGHTWSTGKGFSDAYFFLLDPDGEMIWEQDFGGVGVDVMESSAFVKDSVVAVGFSASYGGNLGGLPWAMRVSHEGLPLWSTVVGQQDRGRFHDVIRTRGGVVAVGEVDVSVDAEETDSAFTQVLVTKFSDDGVLLWEKHIPVGFWPEARAIAYANGGGFLIAGSTQRKAWSSRDGFILRISSTGVKNWVKYVGGLYHDVFNDVVRIPGGSYIAIGASSGPMFNDIWVRGFTTIGTPILNGAFSTEPLPVYGRSLVRLKDGTFAFTADHLLGKFAVTKP